MKKRLLTLFAAMAVLVCMLATCAGETVDTSSPDTSSAAVSIEESSVPEEISRVESSAEENSQAEPEIPEDAVELLFARYTSKPSFVMIGTCAQGGGDHRADRRAIRDRSLLHGLVYRDHEGRRRRQPGDHLHPDH